MKKIHSFGKYYNEHLEEFYDKLNNGELDLDEMIKEREIYNLIEWYYESYATLKTYHEKMHTSLNLYTKGRWGVHFVSKLVLTFKIALKTLCF